MNKLTRSERVAILRCLVDGCSIRATTRITGAAKGTVLKLLVDAGRAADTLSDAHLRDLRCRRLQLDEIWSFVGAKEKNVPAERKGVWGNGDVWTWTALDADTKLIAGWLLGPRNGGAALEFVEALHGRLERGRRVQITTDGLKAYVEAIEAAFGCDVDYAQIIKIYGNEGMPRETHRRYSPAVCSGVKVEVVQGDPDKKHISTSYVERQNLTIRMNMRRFTRLTNAFSKKVENHAHALALHFWHYNFARVHTSLRVTPAMAANVTDRVWDLEDLVAAMEADEDTATDVSRRRKDLAGSK